MSDFLRSDPQGNPLRLRTLVMTRWIAVIGQAMAILIAYFGLGIGMNLPLVLGVVGLSVLANLASHLGFAQSRRLTESEARLSLMFDMCQLALLLFLTGGLGNPFALLMLAPVTISATALTPRSTVLLGLAAIGLVSLLALQSEPLILPDGSTLGLPGVYAFGVWAAIVTGLVFLAVYAQRIASENRTMTDALLATQMALARAQKLVDLGGVVAATAHELGTPLATIKLVSAELIAELADQPDLQDDARLLREQAERCSIILREMGEAGKSDLMLRAAPLETLVMEAAAPHLGRGKSLRFVTMAEDPAAMPDVLRSPELIHGLRNLIQNGVDFAGTGVWVLGNWDARTVSLHVIDDGPGYPGHLRGRLGEPFVRARRDQSRASLRPDYDGMGLGLFIAKTLLERSGATVVFRNFDAARDTALSGSHVSGAVVELTWPRPEIESSTRGQLGDNPRNAAF
jgi:two-component system sensor histidine kinase RegB